MPLLYQKDDTLILACGHHLLLLSSISSSSAIVEFPSLPENGNIISFVVSLSSNYLIACYANKIACCWDIHTRELLGTCQTYKKPTALTLTTLPDEPTTEVLLISDKGGELWAMPVPFLSKKVRLFGHTGSVITDTVVTKTLSCPHMSIFTADRDEKIRVTEFPATYIIQTYLLGHTDVITTLALCQDDSQSTDGYILSAGWDHKLCLWSKKSLSLSDSTLLQSVEEIAQLEVETEISEPIEQPETAEDQQIEENDNDQDESRPFDASKAGSFPMKIVPSPYRFHSISVVPIAIICWQSPEIKLFGIEDDPVNASDHEGRFTFQGLNTIIPFQAPPIDCLWITTSERDEMLLIVLLPPPYCVQIYSIQLGNSSDLFRYQLLELNNFVGLKDLNDFIRLNGFDISYFINNIHLVGNYSQNISFIDIEADGAGIRKHALDKPFDKGVSIEKKIENAKRRKLDNKQKKVER